MNVYIYILIMALVTYLIRVLPLTLFQKEIKSPFIKSFLFYMPYVTLAVMTFPAVLSSTGTWYSALIGFLVAVYLSFKGKNLMVTAACACAVVFLTELI